MIETSVLKGQITTTEYKKGEGTEIIYSIRTSFPKDFLNEEEIKNFETEKQPFFLFLKFDGTIFIKTIWYELEYEERNGNKVAKKGEIKRIRNLIESNSINYANEIINNVAEKIGKEKIQFFPTKSLTKEEFSDITFLKEEESEESGEYTTFLVSEEILKELNEYLEASSDILETLEKTPIYKITNDEIGELFTSENFEDLYKTSISQKKLINKMGKILSSLIDEIGERIKKIGD